MKSVWNSKPEMLYKQNKMEDHLSAPPGKSTAACSKDGPDRYPNLTFRRNNLYSVTGPTCDALADNRSSHESWPSQSGCSLVDTEKA